MVLARKHYGKFRMCVDYRKLNQCTVKDAQPLPRSDNVLEAVGRARFRVWTLLQLLANANSRQRPTKDCIFHTQRPFSMESYALRINQWASQLYHLMNLALDGLTWTYCLVYLDDIIVWSATFDEHLYHLRQVFDRIRKAGLKLKPAKCQFLKKRVTFLGHVMSCKGIETDPEKTRAVDEWPTPENLTELQSFLGLAS